MKWKLFDKIMPPIKKFIDSNSEEILCVAGFGICVGAGIGAAMVTPTVMDALSEAKAEKKRDLTALEKVKVAAPYYVVSACEYALGGHLIFKSVDQSKRKYAGLSAYTAVIDSTLKTYREKVKETVGEKKEKEIMGKVQEQRMIDNPPNQGNVYYTGGGKSWCFDPYSNRYFKFDIGKLQWLENRLNEIFCNENEASLDDYYHLIGLEPTRDSCEKVWSTKLYESKGWIKLVTDPKLIKGLDGTPDSTPCTVIDFNWGPVYRGYLD